MNISELKKELKRLKREQSDAYSELVKTAQLRFKWARLACKLTQEKLAAKLKVNRGTIIKSESMNRGDLESGRVETFVNNYIRHFSKEYDTDWEEFLTITQSQDWKELSFQILITTNKNIDLVKSLISERDERQPQYTETERKGVDKLSSEPRQIFQQVFSPLSTIFHKKRDFFPSEKLFKKDLIFFTRPEHEYINKIKKHFQKKNGENIFLVIGSVATGKTVMAIYIAEKLKEKGYQTLYYKLNAKTSYDRLHSSIVAHLSTNTLFIIDDCHINIEIASEIYDQFNQNNDFYCLLCTRPVPKYVRRLSSLDYQDIFSDLAKKGRVFELNTVDVNTKMFGIIEKYKQHLEIEKRFNPIIGDKNQIIENVKRNYLMLYFYLSFWKVNKPLDKLNETLILEKIYKRYINNATNEPYKDLILKYAALYQYEIEFEPAKKDEEKAKELVNPIAILERDEDTDYYSFYHPNFARLLLESFANRDKFRRQYKNGIEEFTLEQLKSYFADFEKYPYNLQEVFFNLHQNNEINLLCTLLQDPYIKIQVINFFLYESKDAFSLIRFLSLVNNVMPEEAKMYCESLIFENVEIKNIFVTGLNPIYTFARALNLLNSIDDKYPILLTNMFELAELKQFVLSSSFERISQSLHQLVKNEVTEQTTKTLLKNIEVEQLSEKAKDASLPQTGDALNHFNNIDLAKAHKIFENIDSTDLAAKAKKASFAQICNALNYLSNLDRDKALEILDNIGLTSLAEKAKEVDFAQIGNALSDLKNLNDAKAQEIFDSIELADLVEKAKEMNLAQVGNILGDLKNIDEAKAQEIFKTIELADLAEKTKKISFIHIGEALSALKNLDEVKAQKIFEIISLADLTEKAKMASFAHISKTLRILKNFDEAKAQEIFENIELADLTEKAKEMSFTQIGNVLSDLKNLDMAKTQDIFGTIDSADLAKKSKKASFAQVGNTLYHLSNLNKVKAQEICENIEIADLTKKAKEMSLTQIGNALRDLKNIDEAKAQKILKSISITDLVKKTKKGSFDQIGNALRDLNKIDEDKVKKIYKSISVAELTRKAKKASFAQIGNKLYFLGMLDMVKAQKIFENIGLVDLVKIAKKASFAHIGNALSDLINIDEAKAQKIFANIDLVDLTKKAKEATFPQVGKTLVELRNLDMVKARNILDNIALTDLVEKAKKASFSQVGHSLRNLKIIDEAKAQKIFKIMQGAE
jgi:hypothetical protein